MTWLEYQDALQELPLDSKLVVGTGAQASWRLRHADLLPRHFVVSTDDGEARVRPFSSDAVVSLNGRQLSPGPTSLRDGDVLYAGSAQFRFWATTPSEDRLAMAAPPTMAHLVDGGHRSAVSLHRISTGIARDAANALLVDDADVSSIEAEIRREAGGHALRVTNGATVRVNGKGVTGPVLLSEGDEVQIGERVLRYTREPLPEGIQPEQVERVSESFELSSTEADRPRYSPIAALPTAVAPMRAVAFVSSVIAAVAIATLLFLHRGP